jgi:hypothetical protein
MQAPSNRIRGLVMLVAAVVATLATIAPAMAGVGPGPWPN